MDQEYFIPKTIWTYWDTDTEDFIPLGVKQILNNNRKKLEENGWNFIILNNNSINKYINLEEIDFKFDSSSRRSDLIRLKLLYEYGGIWMDASIIINDPNFINFIYENSISNKSDLTSFYLEGCELNNDYRTYIENWLLISPRKNILIKEWILELEKALRMGPGEYYEKFSYNNPSKISGCINQHGHHLLAHLCLQIVLLKYSKIYNILLYPACESAFKLHKECGWNTNCIMSKLFEDPKVKEISLIKLRSPDRPWDMFNYFK